LEEIGHLAFKLLIDQIEGKNAGDSPVIEVLKTKLMVRESSLRGN
jgi:DNA-binding LacI/PurR family transcriptional regulator